MWNTYEWTAIENPSWDSLRPVIRIYVGPTEAFVNPQDKLPAYMKNDGTYQPFIFRTFAKCDPTEPKVD